MIYTDCIETVGPPSGENDPIPWFEAIARDSLGQKHRNDVCVLCPRGGGGVNRAVAVAVSLSGHYDVANNVDHF